MKRPQDKPGDLEVLLNASKYSIPQRLKSIGRLFAKITLPIYLTFQTVLFGATLYDSKDTDPQVSEQVVKYINENVGPLGKAAILGIWTAEEINSYKD